MLEEKKKILEMIENGKITAEQGIKLLEALEETEYTDFVEEEILKEKQNVHSKKQETKNKQDFGYHKHKFEKKFDKFSEKFDGWDEKFSEKMSVFGEEISKKTQAFSEKVLDKIEEVLDSNPFEKIWETNEKEVETEIIEIPSEEVENIRFNAINGKIIFSKTTSENIHLEIKYVLKNTKEILLNKPFNYMVEDNTLTFNPTMRDNITLSIYAELPEKKFSKIEAYTKNGKIELKDIEAESLNCKTKNSGIKISGSDFIKLTLNNKNGKISIDNTKVENINLATANSSININDVHTEKLDAISQNGLISLKDIVSTSVNIKTTNAPLKLTDCRSNYIDCETSNGKILLDDVSTADLKSLSMITSNASIDTKFTNIEKRFHVTGYTNQGKITIDIPNMKYVEIDKNLQGNKKIIGKNYTENILEKDIIKLNARTSNGSIYIR